MKASPTPARKHPWAIPASAIYGQTRRQFMILAALITLMLLAACTALASSLALAAAEPADARFVKCKGGTIQIELDIRNPVPGSVILTLTLPKGTRLIAAEPPQNKYNQHGNQAKWLLRGLSPGRHHINIAVSNDIDEADVRAQIRYLNPANGRLNVVEVIK